MCSVLKKLKKKKQKAKIFLQFKLYHTTYITE